MFLMRDAAEVSPGQNVVNYGKECRRLQHQEESAGFRLMQRGPPLDSNKKMKRDFDGCRGVLTVSFFAILLISLRICL